MPIQAARMRKNISKVCKHVRKNTCVTPHRKRHRDQFNRYSRVHPSLPRKIYPAYLPGGASVYSHLTHRSLVLASISPKRHLIRFPNCHTPQPREFDPSYSPGGANVHPPFSTRFLGCARIKSACVTPGEQSRHVERSDEPSRIRSVRFFFLSMRKETDDACGFGFIGRQNSQTCWRDASA